MNLVADESVEGPIVARLRSDGHGVVYIAEMAPGLSDDDVLQEATSRGAILVTADKDFGDLVFRLGKANSGVLLIRLAGTPNDLKAQIVAQVMQDHAGALPGSFTVVSPAGVRIRGGHTP